METVTSTHPNKLLEVDPEAPSDAQPEANSTSPALREEAELPRYTPPSAPVAQWIEQWFPKPRALVRFRSGASRRSSVSGRRPRFDGAELLDPRRNRLAVAHPIE